MPLVEHLRELRRRLTIATFAIFVGTIVGWYIYPQAFDFLKQPYVDGIQPLLQRRGFKAELVLNGGVGSAFSFRLKLSLAIGLVISSPVWLMQMWGFILPALHRNEKRWAYLLTATGAPLFMGGVAVGYLVLPDQPQQHGHDAQRLDRDADAADVHVAVAEQGGEGAVVEAPDPARGAVDEDEQAQRQDLCRASASRRPRPGGSLRARSVRRSRTPAPAWPGRPGRSAAPPRPGPRPGTW